MIIKTKDGGSAIVCVRGNADRKYIERVVGPIEKTPTLTIPCHNGQHEVCGSCDCDCHKPI